MGLKTLKRTALNRYIHGASSLEIVIKCVLLFKHSPPSSTILHHPLLQMCINVANEQLQHHFNEHIFKWEQEECAKESIAVETICYRSNWPVVDLFLEVYCSVMPDALDKIAKLNTASFLISTLPASQFECTHLLASRKFVAALYNT